MSTGPGFEACVFVTPHLSVGPWHETAHRHGIDLTDAIVRILTTTTTRALPPPWRGDYTTERAAQWMIERDDESPTLLAFERSAEEPVGLVILHREPDDRGEAVRLRIGYVIRESGWGRGLATELVSGLVDWARTRSGIGWVLAGVDSPNVASARVLTKVGFVVAGGDPGAGTVTYVLDVGSADPMARDQ